MLEVVESVATRRLGKVSESDDMIMMLEGFRSALGIDLPTHGEATQQLVYQEKLVGGPHYWVGPFLIPTSQEGPIQIHVSFDQMQKRADIREFGSWAVSRVSAMTEKKMKACYFNRDGKRWTSKAYESNAMYGSYCKTVYPKWENRPSRAHPFGFIVPDKEVMSTIFTNGSHPIAKFDHPTFKRAGGGKQKWGVFLKLVNAGEDKNYPAKHFLFTFKKVDPGFWGKLWDWLVTIVVKVVNTVVDLIGDILSGLYKRACQAATPVLKQIEKSAKKKTELDLATSTQISKKTGMSINAIDGIVAAGTGAGIMTMGESIVSAFCGSDDVVVSPPMQTKAPMSGLMIASIVAGVGVVAVGAGFAFKGQ